MTTEQRLRLLYWSPALLGFLLAVGRLARMNLPDRLIFAAVLGWALLAVPLFVYFSLAGMLAWIARTLTRPEILAPRDVRLTATLSLAILARALRHVV
jgi:hypothetical protein